MIDQCDVCGDISTRWFKDTSVLVCDKPECYQELNQQWEEHCQEIEDE